MRVRSCSDPFVLPRASLEGTSGCLIKAERKEDRDGRKIKMRAIQLQEETRIYTYAYLGLCSCFRYKRLEDPEDKGMCEPSNSTGS